MFAANLRPLWMPLLALVLALGAASAFAAQVCKYDSIRATAPASRFSDNLDGTVTDQAHGLQWKRCAEGQSWSGATCTGTATTHTWQQALQLADTASYAGHADWRLPNIKELSAIVERACYDPAIDLSVFPGTPSYGFRSASPTNYGLHAMIVNFKYGNDDYNLKDYNAHVRLVRGGQ